MVVHGVRFALLDNMDPTSSEIGCQVGSINGPDANSGWKLASPNNPVHRMAVVSTIWM